MVATHGKMTGKLWRLSYGNYIQVRLGVIFHISYVLGKQLIIALTADYGENFLLYEQKLIKNRYLQMEAMSAVTNIQVELDEESLEQLANLEAELPQKFTLPSIRMEN